jgi:hypothetical protein
VPFAAAAADAGKADGNLTVSGKPHKLTYAYAIEMTTDTCERSLQVFLMDVALTDKQIGLLPDILVKEINAGKVHGLRIGIDQAGVLDSVDVYDDESWPSIKEPNKLELKTFNGKTIVGRLHIDKPYNDGTGKTYQYDVKFSAPIRPETDFLP